MKDKKNKKKENQQCRMRIVDLVSIEESHIPPKSSHDSFF
jgi:hypothetical protein